MVDLGDAARVGESDLHCMDAGASALTNRLYTGGSFHGSGWAWRWRWSTPRTERQRIELRESGREQTSIWVWLYDDAVDSDGDDDTWRACDGAVRSAAWAAAHEPLLDLLTTALGSQLTVHRVSVNPGSHRVADARIRVGFAVKETNAGRGLEGVVDMSSELLVAAIARAPQSDVALQGFPLWARCVVDTVTVSTEACRRLSPGALVLLDNDTLATANPYVVLALGSKRWRAEMHDDRLVVGRPIDIDLENHCMTDSRATDDLNECEAGDGTLVADVPVELRFEAGRAVLPLDRACELQPGYVVALDKPLDDQVITIYANGVAVGHGELVLLDERVAVRWVRTLVPVAGTH